MLYIAVGIYSLDFTLIRECVQHFVHRCVGFKRDCRSALLGSDDKLASKSTGLTSANGYRHAGDDKG